MLQDFVGTGIIHYTVLSNADWYQTKKLALLIEQSFLAFFILIPMVS